MDLRSIDLGVAPRTPVQVDPELFVMVPVRDDGEPYMNGAGQPLEITFFDLSSVEGKLSMAKIGVMFPRVIPEDPEKGYTESEAELAARNAMGRNNHSIVRAMRSWNLTGPEGPIEMTPDHVLQLFDLFPEIQSQCADRGLAILRSMGNVKSDSVNGPDNEDGSQVAQDQISNSAEAG